MLEKEAIEDNKITCEICMETFENDTKVCEH